MANLGYFSKQNIITARLFPDNILICTLPTKSEGVFRLNKLTSVHLSNKHFLKTGLETLKTRKKFYINIGCLFTLRSQTYCFSETIFTDLLIFRLKKRTRFYEKLVLNVGVFSILGIVHQMWNIWKFWSIPESTYQNLIYLI